MSETLIGQRLQWAREAAGLKLAQAAKKLDVPSDMLLAMEQGRVTPVDVTHFAEVYDVSEVWLATGEERAVEVPATHHLTEKDRESLRLVLARMRRDR